MNTSAGFVLIEYINDVICPIFHGLSVVLEQKTAPAKAEAVVTHSGKIISSRTGEHGVRL